MVQSIDGAGTKVMIAKMMGKFDTIGQDLLSACSNDIVVMGARPHTFLDYIANDSLDPAIVEDIVAGLSRACKESNVSLVGGETAEMPDTYLPGEHDLVGIVTGFVEKDKIISGTDIKQGDVVLALPSSGLHTNGYSLARKLFFEVGKYSVNDTLPELEKTVGETLLEPHINYTNPVMDLLENDGPIKGMAHITGGGLLENIPRILPSGCGVAITKGSWPILSVFKVMQELGQLDDTEMFRTFNMGVGLDIIVEERSVEKVETILKPYSKVYEIGQVIQDENRKVHILGEDAISSER